MKTFFMNRDKSFDEIKVISEDKMSRTIKFLTGSRKGKTIKAHPEGVAWGNMYPRIFKSSEVPKDIFSFNGRTLVSQFEFEENDVALTKVPSAETYIFPKLTPDIIDSIILRRPIILTGASGVGKTSCILQIARSIKQPVTRINFNGETRMSDLIGQKTLVNGETKWVDGVIPTAMKKGYWLIFDEIDYAPPEIISLLYPITEKTPTLTLKEKEGDGEIIEVSPDSTFRCFVTSNTIGAMNGSRHRFNGTNKMNEAFMNRFDVFHMENMSPADELKLLKERFPHLATNLAKKIEDFASRVRSTDEKEKFNFTIGDFSTRQVMMWAEKVALHRNPYKGAKVSWLDKVPLAEQEFAIKAMNLVFGTKGMEVIQPKVRKKRGSSGGVKKKQQSSGQRLSIAA